MNLRLGVIAILGTRTIIPDPVPIVVSVRAITFVRAIAVFIYVVAGDLLGPGIHLGLGIVAVLRTCTVATHAKPVLIGIHAATPGTILVLAVAILVYPVTADLSGPRMYRWVLVVTILSTLASRANAHTVPVLVHTFTRRRPRTAAAAQKGYNQHRSSQNPGPSLHNLTSKAHPADQV
jgi:hypothetical protein